MGKGVSAACLCVTSGGRRRDEIPRTPRRRSEGWEEYCRASSGELLLDDGDGGDRAWPMDGRR